MPTFSTLLCGIATSVAAVGMNVSSPNCATYTFCEDCASATSWSGTHCRWCPKDDGCHAYGSIYNTCSSSEQVTDASKCPAPTPSPPPVHQDCKTFTDCGGCAAAFSWAGFGSHCRWCPKDGGCHAYGSLYNTCSSSEQIDDVSKCPAPGPTPPPPPPTPGDNHWCDGITLGELPSGDVNIYYAQAPLFSTDPSIGDALGKLGLHHAALVFQQGDVHWTLEFDVTAQNKPGHGMADGFLPKIDGLDLTWDNDARWCLTEGLLHGRGHWVTKFDSFATISRDQFLRIMNEFVPSVNGTNNGRAIGYNLFHVVSASGEEIVADVTCSNGAMWVRDYIASLGVAIPADFGFKATRVEVVVSASAEVTRSDIVEWEQMVDFYKQLVGLLNNPKLDIYGKITAVTNIFPLQFVYDSNRGVYLKLFNGNPSPKFIAAPQPWPLPSMSAGDTVSLVV